MSLFEKRKAFDPSLSDLMVQSIINEYKEPKSPNLNEELSLVA